MNIVVTGGSGYIGTWLIKELIKMGHQIRILDKDEPNSAFENKVKYRRALEGELSRSLESLNGILRANF